MMQLRGREIYIKDEGTERLKKTHQIFRKAECNHISEKCPGVAARVIIDAIKLLY